MIAKRYMNSFDNWVPRKTYYNLKSPSSRGPGHRPFTAATGVRLPLGTHLLKIIPDFPMVNLDYLLGKSVMKMR